MPTLVPPRSTPQADQKAIRFSVIVPVYQHWVLVPDLLGCLNRQVMPEDEFEIILVDNGSTDFAPPESLPSNATVLRCNAAGSYAARNFGAQQARGSWLVFTDADCLPSPQWLQAIYEATIEPDNGSTLLAGPVDVVARSNMPGPYEIYDMVRGIPQARYVGRGYAATANLSVPRPLFELLGGFDHKRFSGGDADFCRRAGARGYRIAFMPEARVEHPARVTWDEVATKARRIKGGQLTTGPKRNRRKWMFRTFAPPARGAWRFLRSTRHPVRYRVIAVLVLLRVWTVEMRELIRLSFGAEAERS